MRKIFVAGIFVLNNGYGIHQPDEEINTLKAMLKRAPVDLFDIANSSWPA